VTLNKGVFLVNTTSLRYFREDKPAYDVNAIALADSKGKFQYMKNLYMYKGAKGLRARYLLKKQVIKLLKKDQQKYEKSLSTYSEDDYS
jgi:predicted secreted protein